MKIVLSILQFLGWSLLAVLLVVIAVLLLLLFCRVHYIVEGEWLEEKWAKFKAHWLFHLVRAKISYGDDLVYGEVYLFWKKFTFSFDLSKKTETEEAEEVPEENEEVDEEFIEDDSDTVVDEIAEHETVGNETVEDEFAGNETVENESTEGGTVGNETVEHVSVEHETARDITVKTESAEDVHRAEEKIIGTETTAELRGEVEPWSESDAKKEDSDIAEIDTCDVNLNSNEKDAGNMNSNNNDSVAKEERIISKIKGMIERIKQVYLKIKKLLADEQNQDAVKHLKNEVLYLIKIFLPKKSKVDAVFSTGSPDTTGQLFGAIACSSVLYQSDWRILPDFESDDAYFKGTFWMKGWIALYQIVGIALRILFDKNCRRLYTMIKKFLKWIKKDDKSQEEK